LAIQEKAVPQDERLAMLLSELGELAARLDEMTSARAHYQRAITVYSANVGPQRPESARCLVGMASTYRLVRLVIGGEQPSSDDIRRALSYYEQALDIFDTKLGRDHSDTIDCLFRFASDLTHASQAQRAKPYLERLLCHFESKQKHELDRSITLRFADIMICLDTGCVPGNEILSFQARLHALFPESFG
jgi:tetratricopeptide (TPR) repeat protein